MATSTSPRLYRRLRKASDLSTATTASSSAPKRMRTSEGHKSCCEDSISNLPDEILIMILDKLDARTIITTTILSKRWLDLPRQLHTSYDFSVDDFIPPRYHRLKQVVFEGKARYEVEKKAHKLTDIYAFKDKYERFYAIKDRYERLMGNVLRLTPMLKRYERQAMRCYVKRVNAFLLAPNNMHQHRSIQKLRLHTFGMSRCIDHWITAAIARWDVEDLELAIDKPCWCYNFQLLDGCQNVRLKRLVLSNCMALNPSYFLKFQRLTELTLCNVSADIAHTCDIMRNCPHLVDLRLKYCSRRRAIFHMDFPTSKLKNLQVDNCSIWKIHLMSLPCLETFACRGQPTKLYYGEVPRLRHVSLNFLQTEDNDEDGPSGSNMTYPMHKFFKGMLPLEYLVLQFRGPQMWIEPIVIQSPLSHLKRLFIANVPMNWDILWILNLLDATPALESLHVHIDNSSEKTSARLDMQVEHRQHNHLKELVVIGFDGAGWQTGFVRQIMRASPRLRRVHLLDGHVVEDDERELGGLEIVPRRREWHECERSEVLDDLTDGSFLQHVEIILE